MDSAVQQAPQYLPLSGGAIVSDQSMRAFLAALEGSGELHRVKRSADPCFEIASVLSLRKHGPAQLFEHVRGHGMPAVGNVLNSRDRFARAKRRRKTHGDWPGQRQGHAQSDRAN